MNKVFFIIGIVFSVIFIFISGYYAELVSNARLDYLFGSYSSYSYDSYNSYSSYRVGDSYSSLTSEAALWSLLFILYFVAMNLVGLIKVKTKTAKVLSIIGLSFGGIILFWDFAVMGSPGAMSFDEVAPAWIFFGLMMLAFSIIMLVQSIRYANKVATGVTNTGVNKSETDLLDS